MTKIVTLGVASEVTMGQYFASLQQDGFGEKLPHPVTGQPCRSKPTPEDEIPQVDAN
jgi:hypothetical protein